MTVKLIIMFYFLKTELDAIDKT